MARPKIKDRGEVKKILRISIADKYLKDQDEEKLKEVATSAIVNHVNQKTE